MSEGDDVRFMRRALRLAARATGRTSPNPLVGSVIVRDGAVIGEGYHHGAGEPHAEVNALRAARDARGATLYTTLEPCAHQGRTPPCVDAIAEAQVARVVAAMRDPDPRIDDKGFRALRAAGVDLTQGVLETEAERLNEGFVSRVKRGRPFVLVALVSTVDGRAAPRAGRDLLGKRALRELDRLRDRYDAVLIGSDSVVADDPALTVRAARGRDPLRVVVDPDAATPPAAKVVRTPDPQRTVIVVARDADPRRVNRLRDAGTLVTALPRTTDGVDLALVLRWLAEHGVNTVLCGPDPTIGGALVRHGLADRLLLLATAVAGGGNAVLAGVDAPVELHELRARSLGDAIAIEAEL